MNSWYNDKGYSTVQNNFNVTAVGAVRDLYIRVTELGIDNFFLVPMIDIP
jgi:hypothetical protein